MKVILIIITAIAAAIALPLFNEKHILDFGNTSDIISALCNCVVAGAAVMAFLSAKNWLYQRMHDDAYKIAKEIIIDDYNQIFKFGSLALSNIENIELLTSIISDDISKVFSLSDCDNYIRVFKETNITPDSIETKIKVLHRFGWSLKSDFKSTHFYFLKDYSDIKKINLHLWYSIRKMLEVHNSHNADKIELSDEIKELIKKTISLKTSFESSYNVLSSYSNTVISYFKIEK
ncbi:hypothetical protein PTR91_00580 [Serratia bockelmannii]